MKGKVKVQQGKQKCYTRSHKTYFWCIVNKTAIEKSTDKVYPQSNLIVSTEPIMGERIAVVVEIISSLKKIKTVSPTNCHKRLCLRMTKYNNNKKQKSEHFNTDLFSNHKNQMKYISGENYKQNCYREKFTYKIFLQIEVFSAA